MAAIGASKVDACQFEEETKALFVMRLRLAIWVTLAFLGVFAVADVVLSRELFPPLLGLKAGQVVLAIGLLAALRSDRGRRWAVPLTLTAIAPFSANLAFGAILVDEHAIPLIEFCGMSVMTAVLFPWGAINQAIAAGILGLTILGSSLIAGGVAQRGVGYSEIGTLAFLACSVFLAHWTLRQRRTLFAAERHLKRTQQRMRDALEAAPTAMLVADRQGRIVLVNRNLESMFGYERKALIGQSVELLVPEEMRAAHRNQRNDFDNSPRMRSMGAGRDLVGLRKDGRVIPVEIGLNPFTTEEDSFVLAALIDITERKQAEQALAEKTRQLSLANEQLTEANTVKEYFAATMAHELRNVFSVLTGYGDLLCESAASNATLADMVNAIQRRAREGQDIINSALELSRRELTSDSHRVTQVSLASLFEELVGDSASFRDRADLRLGWQLPPSVDVIRCDPDKLKMVLRNLLDNAFKFTPRGNIDLTARAIGDGVELIVADTGVGIPPDTLPFVFEPFRQGHDHASRARSGVGLGLYLVKRLVDRMGGSITVESTENVGTTFRITLPAPTAPESGGPGPHAPR